MSTIPSMVDALEGLEGGSVSVPDQRYNLRVAASIEQFSYELTSEALAEQERALAALRLRAAL